MEEPDLPQLGSIEDPAERFDVLLRRFDDSIMPLLNRLRTKILAKYCLPEKDLRISVRIHGEWYSQIELDSFFQMVKTELGYQEYDDFDIKVKFECFYYCEVGLIRWGTTVRIFYDCKTREGQESDKEYRVWHFYFNKEYCNLEQQVSAPAYRNFLDGAMEELQNNLEQTAPFTGTISWDAALNIAHHILKIPEDDLMVYGEKPENLSVEKLSIQEPSWYILGPTVSNWEEEHYFQEFESVVISRSTGRIFQKGPNYVDYPFPALK